MNNNIKIFLKIVIVVVILLNLPFQKVYSQGDTNTASSITTTDYSYKKETTNGKSIYIYNTHQGEKYAENSVKEGSKYLMQLLQKRGYEVDYETTDFELYKTKNHINYAYSYTVSKKYLNNALSKHGKYDLVIDFHRDSIKKSLSTLTYENKNYAKLMFVVGKGSQNYVDVNKRCQTLANMLNEKIPQICRGVYQKQSHYNQGVTDHMMLIEVGANENTFEEVKNSLNILSMVIDEYLSQ